MNTSLKHKLHTWAQTIATSRVFKKGLYALGVLIVAGLIFNAGMIVGFHKASFGRDWNENFSRNFGPRGPHMFEGMPENFPNAHGAFGSIVSVTLPTVIVSDKDKIEKVIVISPETKIISMREEILASDLKPDMTIVVIGVPAANGQIAAKLIRVLPPLPTVPLNK